MGLGVRWGNENHYHILSYLGWGMTVMALPITCASSVMGVGGTTAVWPTTFLDPRRRGAPEAVAPPPHHRKGGYPVVPGWGRSVMLLLITRMITVLGVGRNQPVPLEVALTAAVAGWGVPGWLGLGWGVMTVGEGR